MEDKSRRQDIELRDAINTLNNTAFNNLDCHALYKEALKMICHLHDAPFGFSVAPNSRVYENEWIVTSFFPFAERPNNNISEVAIGESIVSDDAGVSTSGEEWKDSSSERANVLPVKLKGDTSGFSRIYRSHMAECLPNSEVESIGQQLRYHFGWGEVRGIVALPVLDAKEVYCLLCLVNGPDEYDLTMVKRYWPFLTSVASLHRQKNSDNKVDVMCSAAPALESQQAKKQASLNSWSNAYHLIEEHVPIALIELDQNLKITRFNPKAETLFLVAKEDALGRALSDFIPERFPNEHRIHTFSLLSGSSKNNQSRRFMGRTESDQPVPIQVNSVVYTRHDQPHRLLMIADCTELDVVKQEQEAEVQRFRALAKLAPVGILQTNAQWESVYINDRWCEIAQREADEIETMGWISSLYYEDLADTLEFLRQAMMAGREYNGQCRLQSPIGDIIWVEFHARPLYSSKGEMNGFLATMTDCTYRYETEQELRRLAERDMLTGLPNRVLFQDRLNHALARAKRSGSLALLSLDLDGFKDVNDNLGHDAGDVLLTQVAERLTRCVRESDTVARVGGDEFLILLESINHAEVAAKQSEKLLGRLAEPFYIHQQEVFISGSIGITFAVGGQGYIDAQAVLKQVDLALYRAKQLGRNNYQYYSPEFELATKDKLSLGNSLHRALDRSEFCIYYQLQADLKTNGIVGSEALLRWEHPERGMLAPSEFIGLLEETGIIVRVSRWIVSEAFAQHRRWLNEGLIAAGSHIAINLTPRLLRDESFVTHFIDTMKAYQLSGSEVMVEITESALLERSAATMSVLETFEQAGVQIALDDFGTGYSSLSYLKRFPIKTIKIDQSFVRDLLTDSEDAAITKGIIRLAHSLNLSVVAEGVDDVEKIKPLREWGCHSFQGYCLNQPTPEKKTTQLLREQCQVIA